MVARRARPAFSLTCEDPAPEAPAAFGHPIAGESLGEGLTIYVYDRDLASYLSP